MKETKKKSIYLFNIIMGAICVLLLGMGMITYDTLILKVLFVVALVAYVGLVVCFLLHRKKM